MKDGNPKVLKYFVHRNFNTGQLIKYAHVVVKNELVNVRAVKFRQDNVYDVPASNIEDRNAYVEPFLNPDYNVHRSFHNYRKIIGFIQPSLVKQFCKIHRISQSTLSKVLGMGVSMLSKLGNDRFIQKLSQDTQLRCVMYHSLWLNLKKSHLPISKIKRTNYSSYSAYKRAVSKAGYLVKPQVVKKARTQLGLSIYEVGAILGLSVSALSKIENGKLIPSVSQDTRLRCLLDTNMFTDLLKAHTLTMKRAPFVQAPHVKVNRLEKVLSKLTSRE